MLVKLGGNDDEIKIINLSNGDEAVLNEETYELLISVSKKENREICLEKELELLASLFESLEIEATNGSGELITRSGSFENLEIYLTNTCNIRCRHCYFFGEGRHLEGKHVDFDILVRTIIEAEEMGLYKIKLCGGEPLAYCRTKELLHFLNSRKIRTMIITNGLLIDEFIDEIDSSKLSFVVSLDGFEHSHDYLRGNGTFERTKNNIEKAISAGCDVAVNMVVYDKNVDDIERFTEFVRSVGVSGLNIQVVRPVGLAAKNLKNHMVIDESFLREIHQNELGIQFDKITDEKNFCTSCKTGLTMDFNNHVLGCQFLSEKPIGSLVSESLRDIHERSLIENPLYFVAEKAECSNCELFNVVCVGGCRARAKKMTGSIYGCDYWIPFLLNHSKFKESKREAWEYLLI